MRFKPVYFGFADCTVRKLYRCSPFPLPPPAFAISALQIAPDVYAPACSDCLDVSDLAEDLKGRHHPSSLRYLFRFWRAA